MRRQKKHRQILQLIAALIWLLLPLNEVRATNLTGTFKRPDGSPVNGRLILLLSQPARLNDSSAQIVPMVRIFAVTNGVLEANAFVYGNDVLLPSGTYYLARLVDTNNNLLFEQKWSLQGTDLDLGTLTPTTIGVVVPDPLLKNATAEQAVEGPVTFSAPLSIFSLTLHGNINLGSPGSYDLGDDSLPWRRLVANEVIAKGPRPWVDVRAYGAKCDGTTDDSAAFTNALAAAKGSGSAFPPFFSNGVTMLFIPAGDCVITSKKIIRLLAGHSGIIIRGAGKYASRINYTYDVNEADNFLIHHDETTDGTLQRVKFQDLSIQGPGGGAGNFASLLYRKATSGTGGMEFENVIVRGFQTLVVLDGTAGGGNNTFTRFSARDFKTAFDCRNPQDVPSTLIDPDMTTGSQAGEIFKFSGNGAPGWTVFGGYLSTLGDSASAIVRFASDYAGGINNANFTMTGTHIEISVGGSGSAAGVLVADESTDASAELIFVGTNAASIVGPLRTVVTIGTKKRLSILGGTWGGLISLVSNAGASMTGNTPPPALWMDNVRWSQDGTSYTPPSESFTALSNRPLIRLRKVFVTGVGLINDQDTAPSGIWATNNLRLIPETVSDTPLTVRGLAGQSANLFNLQNSGGSNLFRVAANGDTLHQNVADAALNLTLLSGNSADQAANLNWADRNATVKWTATKDNSNNWALVDSAASVGRISLTGIGASLYRSGSTSTGHSFRLSDNTELFAIASNGSLTITSTVLTTNLNAEMWNGKKAIDFSASLDFGTIAANTCAELTITATGAQANDPVVPSWPAGLEAGLVGLMHVTSADTVTVRLCNVTTGSVDPASHTFAGRVVR